MHSASRSKNIFRGGSQVRHHQTHTEKTEGKLGGKVIEYKHPDEKKSPEAKPSNGFKKVYHHKSHESTMMKTKSHRPRFSHQEKIAISDNINILHERRCQLISKRALLEVDVETPEGSKVDQDKKMDDLHKIEEEAHRISELTEEILNPGETTYEKEIIKFYDLILEDSRVEETRDNSFQSMVELINQEIQEALNAGNEVELIEHEKNLSKLYQKKIKEDTEKLNILKQQPFNNIIPTETFRKIHHLESEIKKLKGLNEELTAKISLWEEVSTESDEAEVLNTKFEYLDHTIEVYEEEFSKSNEIHELSIKRKSTKNKLEAKLAKVMKKTRALRDLIKNGLNVNSKELERVNTRYEKLEEISRKSHDLEERQIKRSENMLKIKSLEKKVVKINEELSKKIDALTDDWEAKSTSEQEEALKKIKSEYESSSSLWEKEKETVDTIAKICKENGLTSHELTRHEALKGIIFKVEEDFKNNGTVDKNLIYILKKTASNSAILSTSLLKKISKMSRRVLSGLAIAGIALAIYIYTVFKNDEKNFKVAKENVSDYEILLNQVDSLMKYRKAINEKLNQDQIPLTDDQIAEYNQTLEEFEKIKARMKKLDDFFTTPSLSKKIDIGDKLAHKIYQMYPNALIERDENSNDKLGTIELLRNPWASKKVIENFKESGETIFHNKVDTIVAESGLFVDHVVDMFLPEEVNFRKAYSAHAGISASIRLIDSALKYDTQVLDQLKTSLLDEIRDFEEKAKSDDESRYFASWRGHTDDFEAMEKGQKERTGTLAQHREIKRKKAARKEEIARQIEKKPSHQ